ncbi:ABC transporter permease [Tumebacillus algifaecis]|uniref:ABC transporter permease n=1 Tax=Tumebacillus algifaecis TaxID=1214604 RepID=A0A223CZR6_9BACL|nr:ABC transporter permease [Tumebacillus algifaecis]ASS74654.1 ABC transporter permease [Tumebacillus algifaecis]
MVFALLGSIESGLIFAFMALGVYLTFRILDFPDLTVDGSFTAGGAAAATLLAAGYHPLLSTVVAVAVGILAGSVTGLLHTKGKINPLLAGILTMIALYSVNLRIMGRANVPLLNEETLVTKVNATLVNVLGDLSLAAVMVVAVVVVKLGVDWFLRTEKGLMLRATGDNERMIRSFGANTDGAKVLGLALSNGLVALAGALMAQYQGFADVSMGIGMIVIGLASVIIGEAIFGRSSIARATAAVIGGAILYRLIVAFALQAGVNPSDLKLITALIVIFALISPKTLQTWKAKSGKKRRHSSGGESHVEA